MKQIYKNNKDVLLLSLSQTQINPNIIYSLTYSITGVGQLLDNGVPLNSTRYYSGSFLYPFYQLKVVPKYVIE